MTVLLCWNEKFLHQLHLDVRVVYVAAAWTKSIPIPITMEPSYYQQLESQLEDYKTWATKGAIIDGYVVNDSGEEKIAVDICSHISCDSNETKAKKDHQNAFQSRLKQGLLEKIYLSASFNEFDEKGRGKVIKMITNLFDTCGGGIRVVATTETTIAFECFRHRVHKPKKKDPKKKSRNTSTTRPQSKEDNCLWRFTLQIEPLGAEKEGRYFFYRNGSGNHFHNGHAPRQ